MVLVISDKSFSFLCKDHHVLSIFSTLHDFLKGMVEAPVSTFPLGSLQLHICIPPPLKWFWARPPVSSNFPHLMVSSVSSADCLRVAFTSSPRPSSLKTFFVSWRLVLLILLGLFSPPWTLTPLLILPGPGTLNTIDMLVTSNLPSLALTFHSFELQAPTQLTTWHVPLVLLCTKNLACPNWFLSPLDIHTHTTFSP